jgi:ParB-like chromosome segregation protein Spo0J
MKCVFREIKIGEIRLDPIRGQSEPNASLVEALVESFDAVGMLHMPIVRKAPKGSRWRGYWLITGGKRFAAAKKDHNRARMWCRVIVCDDEQALEIFLRENLDRLHYTATQVAAARREVTEAARRRESADRFAPGRMLHVKNAAKATGFNPRTIERDNRFAEQLIPEARTALNQGRIDTKLAEKLCRMDGAQQEIELPVLVKAKSERKARKPPVSAPTVQVPRPVQPGGIYERVASFLSTMEALVRSELYPILGAQGLDDALLDVEPAEIKILSNIFLRLNDLVGHLPREVVMHSRALSELSRAMEFRWDRSDTARMDSPDDTSAEDSVPDNGNAGQEVDYGRTGDVQAVNAA